MKESLIVAPEILLPNTQDMQSFACIACDQFTSEIDYWKELEKIVGDKISTLNLILPEIYLNGSEKERIEKINANMRKYLDKGVFRTFGKGFILTVRKTAFVERRIGLVCAIDLEEYEYNPKIKSLIRATEGTIEERIPPRLKIRKDAELEFPHVMVLFDDEKREIAEELYKKRNNFEKVYDFELNMNGGSIEGYFIKDYQSVIEKFSSLLDEERLISKYGKVDQFLFAVGDGNHSLATAKTHWNNLKDTLSEQEKAIHPARYALVELNNIYDDGIYFEPIHRFVNKIDRKRFISELKKINFTASVYYGEENSFNNGESLPASILSVDSFIKEFIEKNGGTVDYVHGEENIKQLVDKDENSVAILFDKLDKKDLFKYVSNVGPFPRKTFSMGEAIEKRYYLEGRKIKL